MGFLVPLTHLLPSYLWGRIGGLSSLYNLLPYFWLFIIFWKVVLSLAHISPFRCSLLLSILGSSKLQLYIYFDALIGL